MKKVIGMFAVLAMFSILFVGCGNADDPKAVEKPKAVEEPKTVEEPKVVEEPAKSKPANWEPETSKKPGPVDPHAGHDHGPGGHGH